MAAPLAAACVAVVTAVLGVVHAQPAAAAVGDVHWFLSNDRGNLGPWDVYQHLRRPDGTFASRVRVTAQAGVVQGNNYSLSAVKLLGRMHLFMSADTLGCVTCPRNGALHYSMQNADGTWPAWTTILAQTGNIIPHVVAAAVGAELHVVVTGPPRGENTVTLLHSVRDFATGQWRPFQEFASFASHANSPRLMAAAGTSSGLLHVVVNGSPASGPERMLHTVRSPNGTWSTMANILGETGRPWTATDNPPYGPRKLVAAAVGSEIHLLYENFGVIFHTIRGTNGSWLPFGNMSTVTGLARNDLEKLSATALGLNGDLLVAGVHGPANDLRYTIRRANGSWDAWTSNPLAPTSIDDIGKLVVASG
ncbi:hypothetical protein [Paractinoplanes rishiriensis]|uniref:hypothetical protein n=1 Tax=Paractinoplanes rishiriensis TaxID=1050105 RepID=UPI0019439EDF|nr:hypothetical protein [Actinoplanes rishiriensis]